MTKNYECDILGYCPHSASRAADCMKYCGLGHDEDTIDINYDELEEEDWDAAAPDTWDGENLCLEELVLRRLL